MNKLAMTSWKLYAKSMALRLVLSVRYEVIVLWLITQISFAFLCVRPACRLLLLHSSINPLKQQSMKEVLKFRVAVEKADGTFEVSDVIDTYEDAQKWRHQREAELLRDCPTIRQCHSNLIFVRIVEGAQ